MSDKRSGGSGGIGFVGMLTILFVGLKLAGVISWSWWWVLSPLWISAILLAVLLSGCGLFIAFCYFMDSRQKAAARKHP